jgi:hypothetical protein
VRSIIDCFVSPFLKQKPPEHLVFEVLKGLVGITTATKFVNHIKSNKGTRLRAEEVMTGYNKEMREIVKLSGLDMLNILNEEILILKSSLKYFNEILNLKV